MEASIERSRMAIHVDVTRIALVPDPKGVAVA
jgi:hypothetical protein